VQDTIDRVTRRPKRQRTPNDNGSPSRGSPDPHITQHKKDLVQKGNKRTKSGVSVTVASVKPREQRSQSSKSSAVVQTPSPAAIHTSQWVSELNSSFDEETTWPFDSTSLNQLDHTATQSTEQAIENGWLLLLSNTPPAFPTANVQDQGSSSGVDYNEATNFPPTS
jgi:hypothetical protein